MNRNTEKIVRFGLLFVAGGLAACLTRPLVRVDPETESFVKQDMTQVQFSGVDILVLVDNSKSMAEEQGNLAEEFPGLIQSLLNPPIDPVTGQPAHVPVKDLHIGVISSDMGTGGYTVETCSDPVDGDDGVLKHTPNPLVPGCASTYSTYLSYNFDTPSIPDINAMATGFGCIATLGTNGCGFEQQLKAVARAVEHTHPTGPNAGFLRAESILTILFVTDEEDCSVADTHIFDTADTSLGHLNLRCYLHPYMVQPVDQYINLFRGYRADIDKLVLAFIVGVPLDPVCEGFGDQIPNCLTHPDMVEEIDPADPTRLAFSCNTSTGYAFPPRRLVSIAQTFGANALVRSICTDNFQPAIDGLTEKLHDVVDSVQIVRELETAHDPLNPCRCVATCTIIEQLIDLRPCPAGKPCYDPEGDGTCATDIDEGGIEHTLCEVPQAGTLMVGCDPASPPECNAATHRIDGVGWYYIGQGWTLEGVGVQAEPVLNFTDGMTPEEGSNVYIQCNSSICPETRQCGTMANHSASCCPEDQFCNCNPEIQDCGLGYCLPRPE